MDDPNKNDNDANHLDKNNDSQMNVVMDNRKDPPPAATTARSVGANNRGSNSMPSDSDPQAIDDRAKKGDHERAAASKVPSGVTTSNDYVSWGGKKQDPDGHASAKEGQPASERSRTYDVLFGAGKKIREHPGNVRMRRIILNYTDRYKGARKGKKQGIAEEVKKDIEAVCEIDDDGRPHVYQANFLKYTGDQSVAGEWIEADLSEIHEKIKHCLRDMCKVRAAEDETPLVLVDTSNDCILEENVGALLSAFRDDTEANRTIPIPADHSLDYHQPNFISAQDREDQPLVPNRFDVIFGRGAPIRNFPGNVRMRRMIEENALRYYGSTKYQKGRIVNEIIEELGGAVRERSENGTFRTNNVRFLISPKPSGGRYQIADAETIKLKVRRSMTDYINKYLKQPVADVKQAPVSKRKRDGDDDEDDKDDTDRPFGGQSTTTTHFAAAEGTKAPPTKSASVVMLQSHHVITSSDTSKGKGGTYHTQPDVVPATVLSSSVDTDVESQPHTTSESHDVQGRQEQEQQQGQKQQQKQQQEQEQRQEKEHHHHAAENEDEIISSLAELLTMLRETRTDLCYMFLVVVLILNLLAALFLFIFQFTFRG